MTTRPQNYIKNIKDINNKNIPGWHFFADETYTSIMAPTTAYAIPIPVGCNFCKVISNFGQVFIDPVAAITAIPTSFAKTTIRLIDLQGDNYFYLKIGSTNFNIYNHGTAATEVTIIFGRTLNQLQDAGTPAIPCGDVC